MGIISLRRSVSDFGTGADLFRSSLSKAGVRVDYSTVSSLSTAWRCATLIADTIYSMPIDELRRRDGIPVEVQPRSQIVDSPHPVLTAAEWRYQATISLAFWGNAYGVAATEKGSIVGVEWVNPDRISVITDTSGISYLLNGQRIPDDQVVHLRRYPQPGTVVGLSPLERQKETFGLAAAGRNFAAQFFSDAPHPSGLLTTESAIDEQQAKIAKNRFLSAIKGREPVTLGGTWKYTPLKTTSPQDADLAHLVDQMNVAVCQAFGVAPEMVGVATSGSSITYANREQRSLDFLTFTLQPWLKLWEEWLTANIPGPRYVKFNPGSLLRTDIITRYRAHDMAIRMGMKSVNEVRALEDLEPVDDPLRDDPLWPPYRSNPTDLEQERI